MNVTERPWYAILFMFIITFIVSTILIIFGNATRQRVLDNQRVAFRRAILDALPVQTTSTPSDAIHEIFADSIITSSLDTGVYEFRRDGTVIAYALPVSGAGFWAPIKGVIGIAADMRTITGLSIYEQNETPGLGGEIVKPYFRDQFREKRIADGPRPIQIRPVTDPIDEHSVHAITGATQTSTRLEVLLNERLQAWRDQQGSTR